MPLTLLFFFPGLLIILIGGYLLYRRRWILGTTSVLLGLGLIALPFVLFGMSSM